MIDASRFFLGGEHSDRFIRGFEPKVGPADAFEITRASVSLQGVRDNGVWGKRIPTADGLGSFAVHSVGIRRVADRAGPQFRPPPARTRR